MKERTLSDKERYALDLIGHACELMGWEVALPENGEAKEIYWLIIGTSEGIDTAMKRMNGDCQ